MGKLFKINIVLAQLWEKPIYKLLSCFLRQQFFGGGGAAGGLRGKEPIKCLKLIHFATTQLHVNALTNLSFITSFTSEQF